MSFSYRLSCSACIPSSALPSLPPPPTSFGCPAGYTHSLPSPLRPQIHTCPHACIHITVIYVPKYDPSLGGNHTGTCNSGLICTLSQQLCIACTGTQAYSVPTQALAQAHAALPNHSAPHGWEGGDTMRPALAGDPLPGLGCGQL